MSSISTIDSPCIEDRIGSLEVGKDADLQVLEGHPFDYRVLPQMVFIDGKRVN